MLDSLMYTVNGVCPVLLMIVIGFVLRQTGMRKVATAENMNKICFKVLLPCSLFKSIYNMDLNVAFNAKFVGYCVAGIMFETAILALLVPFVIKDRKRVGSFIQGVYRGNFLLLGLPLATNLFGTDGENLVSMLMPFAIICFNVFAVIVLTVYGSGDGKAKINVKSLLLGIVKNPLIGATVVSVLLRLLPFRIPAVFNSTIGNVASMATPLALLVLGAQFNPKGFKNNFRTSFIAAMLRLVAFPALFVAVALLLGFEGAAVGCVFILFGVSTAVSSHIMAINLGCDGDLAGDILVCTAAFSMLTLFLGIFLMRTVGII